MIHTRKSLWRGAIAVAAVAGFVTSAAAQMELKIMAPAAPGGGWDQTARSMQQALTQSGIAKSAQVTNVPGAGGSVGIAQFVNSGKGDGNQLMVMGYVMVGALLTNKSPVTLDQTTPIARLTAEYEALVVPADSPIKNAKDLAAAVKADPAKVTWAGGSAGGVDHIAAALFAKEAGADPTKINYIPFSGGGEATENQDDGPPVEAVPGRQVAAEGRDGIADGQEGEARGDDDRHHLRAEVVRGQDLEPGHVPPGQPCQDEENEGDDEAGRVDAPMGRCAHGISWKKRRRAGRTRRLCSHNRSEG